MEIFPWIKLSWHYCSMWDKLGWLNWFQQFLCKDLSYFNPKKLCYSYAWSCSLCEGKTFYCMDLSLKKSVDSYLCFQLALYHSVPHFRFIYLFCLPSLPLYMVFWCYFIRHRWVLSIKPSTNVFYLETLTSIIKTG